MRPKHLISYYTAKTKNRSQARCALCAPPACDVFLGVYKVKLQMMDTHVTFVIMDSLIGEEYRRIERLYDLKGSTHGRETKLTPEQERDGSGLKTLKDLNFKGMDIA